VDNHDIYRIRYLHLINTLIEEKESPALIVNNTIPETHFFESTLIMWFPGESDEQETLSSD
jgi:hypothetical protein